MKINMWLIEENLKKYNPKYDITDGTACISGVRFFSGEEHVEFLPQYVYMYLYTDVVDNGEATALINGRDIIILQSSSINDVLNDLLAIFDYYNSWETSVWEVTSGKSLQKIIDMTGAVMGNPMVLADIDGKVLAMSSDYLEEDINRYWMETRESRHIPMEILGAPMRSINGQITSWTEEPEIYILPDGHRIIGTFLRQNGEYTAALGLWEYKKDITPGDLCIVKVLCSVLCSVIDGQESAPLRSISDILTDLLSGIEIDHALLEKLEIPCRPSWELLVIHSSYRSDIAYKRGIVKHLQDSGISCVPFIYQEHILVLISEKHAGNFIQTVLEPGQKHYLLIGRSLPFDNLPELPVRYRQTLFALSRASGKPGIYDSRDYAFPYLLSLLQEQNQMELLSHPALRLLRQYDEKHGSGLYDTLFQYLFQDRSIQKGAEALHIHRNSFLYRIHRIKELTQIDLEDPSARFYLMLSFLLERSSLL